MERLPVELLLALGFLAIVIINYVAQQAARRRAQQEPRLAPAPAPVEDEPLEVLWGRSAARSSPPAPALTPEPPAPPAPAPATPRRLHPVRALLKDGHDLRRAFVLVMVLGPCRAEDPPGR